MKLSEMAKVLLKQAVAFQSVTVDEPMIAAWYRLFDREDVAIFDAALLATVREPGRKFFPAPGEVAKTIDEIKSAEMPPAALVWEQLVKFACRGVSEEFVINAIAGNRAAVSALRQVGYSVIRWANIETELPHRKRDFERYYSEAIDRQQRGNVIAIGREEAKMVLANLGSSIKTIGGAH